MIFKHNSKLLTILLKVVSITTLINILVLYWLPINAFLSSFSAVKIVALSFLEKRYYLIPASVLICTLLFFTTISIRRQHILLPVLSLVYLIYDFATVLSLLIDGLYDGYWKIYIIQTIVLFVLIVLLCIYCWAFFSKHMFRRN